MLWRLATVLFLIALVVIAAPVRPRAGGPGFEVLVLQRETRAPVPGCELRWLAEAELAALGRARTETRADSLRRFGRVTRTDHAGRAWLVDWHPDALQWIDARVEDLHEQTHFWGQPARGAVIEVEREVELSIEVTDRAGAPAAGVPVAVLSEHAAAVRGFTDESGRARLRAPRRLIDGVEPLVASFAFPNRGGHGKLVDEAARAGEPVRLTLPPTGSVALRTTGPDGAPRAVALDLSVRRRTYPGEPAPANWHVAVVDGRGLLDPCEVGVPLEVWGRPLGVIGMVPLARVPREEGERVELELAVPEPVVEVAARVLRPDGTLLRRAGLELERVHDPARSPREGRVQSDAHGRFEVVDDAWSARAPLTRVLVRHRDHKGAVFEAVAQVDPARAEPVELGDLVLAPVPEVAAGRAVDEDGRPVAGATVILWEDDRARGYARGVRRTLVTTGADGRFALHAHLETADYEVHASCSGYLSAAPAPVGERGLELVLRRAVRIEGRASLARVPAVEGLTVMAVEPGVYSYGEAPIRPDGSIVLEGVPAGDLELQLRLRGHATLASFALRVPRVDVFRPELLAPLDVSRYYRELALEVVDRAGRPVGAGAISARPEGIGRRYLDERPLDGRPIRFPITSRPVTLEVCAPGFRALRLEGVVDDTTLVLEPGYALELRLAGGLEPPPPPAVLGLRCAPPRLAHPRPPCLDDLPHGKRGGQLLELGLDGLARHELPVAGEWTLEWWLDPRADGASPRSLGTASLLVRDVEELQVFDLMPLRHLYAPLVGELRAAARGR